MNAKKINTSQTKIVGHAQSKLILIGEHSVVYGQPAIALPFPLIGVEATVEHSPGDIYLKSDLYAGSIDQAPTLLSGIVCTIKHTLQMLNLPDKNLLIEVESTIPPGKGLGSSAAVATAVVKSLFVYAGETYTNKQILSYANIAETHAHGSPSGIDSLTVNSDKPVWYEMGKTIDYIDTQGEFHFVVADSGREADTKTAVGTVKELMKATPEKIERTMNRLGEITYQVRESLESSSKQMLGTLLNEAQKELVALGVSDLGLNKLITFVLNEGALGAKLTGAGNGGCIIALAKNQQHSRLLTEKLLKSGVESVWPFTLKNNKAK